jgi:hypothetical protein
MRFRFFQLVVCCLVLVGTQVLAVAQAPGADAASNKKTHTVTAPTGRAQTSRAPTGRGPTRTPTLVADATQRCRGSHLFHCGPLYNANDYLGNDPDPFIRLMIQRDLGIKYGGPE